LFLNKLHVVYHGETGIRTLKELARSYLTITRDLTHVMNRLKAIYRGWGLLVLASKCMHLATAPNGLRRSPKPACADGPGPSREGPSGHSDIVAVNDMPRAIYLTQEKVAATATQSAAEIVNV